VSELGHPLLYSPITLFTSRRRAVQAMNCLEH
jgi:hypothetical protein